MSQGYGRMVVPARIGTRCRDQRGIGVERWPGFGRDVHGAEPAAGGTCPAICVGDDARTGRRA